MKLSIKSPNHQSGFTLVELLVVIGIIATLATLGTVGAKASMENARKMESRADLVNVTGALNSFYSDYGIYPDVPSGTSALALAAGDSVLTLDGSANAQSFVKALCGEDNTLNPRDSKYLEADNAKANGSKGIAYDSNYSFNDYYGNPYVIIWDSNYDGELLDPLVGASAPSLRVKTAGVGTGSLDVATYSLSTTLDIKSQKKLVTTW